VIEARLALYLIALVGLLGGGSYAGWTARDWKAAADERQANKAATLVMEARQQAALGAADAIAKIEVRNVTIRQKTEREILERPVYRDCRADDRVFALTNEALTGRSAGGSDSGLPGTVPAQ